MTDTVPTEDMGCPLAPFLREAVRYRGLTVSRYVAMTFEHEMCGDDRSMVAVGSVPAADLEQVASPLLDDEEAICCLYTQFMGHHVMF